MGGGGGGTAVAGLGRGERGTASAAAAMAGLAATARPLGGYQVKPRYPERAQDRCPRRYLAKSQSAGKWTRR